MQLTEQQHKALDLNRHLGVTAGAGSGKTTVLVQRYLKILLSRKDTSVRNILAITFTDRAAQEMKQRIHQALLELFEAEPALRPRIFEILKEFSQARIQTIHSFCSTVLKEQTLLSHFDPDFQIVRRTQIRGLLQQVFWAFFFQYSGKENPGEIFRLQALRHLDVAGLKNNFYTTYYRRNSLLPFLETYRSISPEKLISRWEAVRQEYYEALFYPLWNLPGLPSLLSHILSGVGTVTGKSAQKLSEQLKEFAEQIGKNNSGDRIECTIQLLNLLFTQQRTPRKQLRDAIAKAGGPAETAYSKLLEVAQSLVGGILEDQAGPGQVRTFAEFICGLSDLLVSFLNEVDRVKKSLSVVDFDDLLWETLQLLRIHPEVLRTLRHQYAWILVDEFQDTDAVQSEIIGMLARNSAGTSEVAANLFIVGDPKQSIYGFRQADVTLFGEFLKWIQQQKTESIPFQAEKNSGELPSRQTERRGVIPLPDNFRSSPVLITFFNVLFERLFRRESVFDVHYSGLKAGRKSPKEVSSQIQMELVVYPNSFKKADYLPYELNALVQQIRRVVGKSGLQVLDTSTDKPFLRPACYGDIAILIRERNKLPQMETALRQAAIPYDVYRGVGFFQTSEVQDIYYMLKAISDPEDNFAMISVLRAPYLGLSDSTLLFLSQCRGENYLEKLRRLAQVSEQQPPWHQIFNERFAHFLETHNLPVQIRQEEFANMRTLVRNFPRWQVLANRARFSQLLNDILTQFNIAAVLRTEEHGKQKSANLVKLTQFVYDFEQRESGHFFDLLELLRESVAGDSEEGEASLPESRENKIHIYTIHSVKGLEFPIVFLPFLEDNFNYREQIYFHKDTGILFPFKFGKGKSFIQSYFSELNRQKIRAEEKRLLYVAATRARDHLFLIGATSQRGPSTSSYLGYILDSLSIELQPLILGEPLEITELGFRLQPTLVEEDTPPPEIVPEAIPTEFGPESTAPSNEYAPSEIVSYLPSIQVPKIRGEYSPTQLMIFEEDPERFIHHYFFKNGVVIPPQVATEYQDESTGLWFGTLVHKALEKYHLRNEQEDAEYVDFMLDQLFVPAAEKEAVRSEALNVLRKFRSCALGEFLNSAPQRSEIRLTAQLSSGKLVGVLDRLYFGASGLWEALDFKTNRVDEQQLDGLVKKYQPQMEYYALLLSHVFPEQKTYPVRIFFLTSMKEHLMVFTPQQVRHISEKADKLIRKIQNLENTFFENYFE